MKKLISMLAGLSLVLTAMAQPGGFGPKHEGNRPMKKQLTVEQEAQMKVDQMASEMPLTDKQLKKLTKFYKKDIKYRREHFPMEGFGKMAHEHGGPMKGGHSMPDGQSMGGGFNGQSMGGGFNGQSGYGQPPQGGPGMGFGGPGNGHGPGHGHGMGGGPMQQEEWDLEQLEKYNAKQDKKLKKIIGEENFALWSSSHPHEYPQLPEMDKL